MRKIITEDRNIAVGDESENECELAPGLLLSRRSFVASSGAAIATSSFLSAAAAMDAQSSNNFDAFLKAANAEAGRLVGDISAEGQDRYLRTVAAQASGLTGVPLPKEWRDSGQSDKTGTFIGFNPGGVKFIILHWRMEPGTRINPHAHTYGNVVTVGLEGTARVRNYEVVGERDYLSDDEFVVRRTIDQILRAGSINLVSLERNYIHGIEAGDEGARGLDITTRLLPKPDHGVPYLSVSEPIGNEGPNQKYLANWKRG